MTLKGYEFYDDNNETEAMFLFKYLYLYIKKPITKVRLEEIKQYIQEQGHSIHKVIETYEEQEEKQD